MHKSTYIYFTFFLSLAFIASSTAFAGPKVFDIDEAINFNEAWYKKSLTEEENFRNLIKDRKSVV